MSLKSVLYGTTVLMAATALMSAPAMSEGGHSKYGDKAQSTQHNQQQMNQQNERTMSQDTRPGVMLHTVTFATLSGYSAESIRGANVLNANGDEIAEVEDIHFSRNFDKASLVLKESNLVPFTGKKVSVPFDSLTLVVKDEDEIEFRSDITSDNLSLITGSAQVREDDNTSYGYRLEEVIDSEVELAGGEESADIDDIVIGNNGEVRFVVLSVGDGIMGFDDDQVAVSMKELRPMGEEGYSMQWSQDELLQRGKQEARDYDSSGDYNRE